MRKIPFFFWLLGAAACTSPTPKLTATTQAETTIQAPLGYEHRGLEAVNLKAAVPVATAFQKALTGAKNEVTVSGEVEKVCQMKGCWMTLKVENTDPIRVTFKDYAFFMPKDLSGKKVIAKGFFESKTQSVEELRHLASDEGKPAAELEAIQAPKTSWTFLASGVLIAK